MAKAKEKAEKAAVKAAIVADAATPKKKAKKVSAAPAPAAPPAPDLLSQTVLLCQAQRWREAASICRRVLDRAKRAEKYARIQEILYEDQPYTWLYWRNSFYGFSKDLRGYVFSPRGPFHYSPGFGSLWMPRE